MDFSSLSLDSLYNFTHDWLYYKNCYDEIEAGMIKIGSYSEIFKATLHCFCLHAHVQFIGWHARRASRLYDT